MNTNKKYRLLLDEEAIEAGDEISNDHGTNWLPVSDGYIGLRYAGKYLLFRREIPVEVDLHEYYKDILVTIEHFDVTDVEYLVTQPNGNVTMGLTPYTAKGFDGGWLLFKTLYPNKVITTVRDDGIVERNGLKLHWTETLLKLKPLENN